MPTTGEKSVWRNPSFVLLWSGQFVSALGSKVSGLALPLLVLSITDSPAQAGFIASARMIPYLVLGLPAGALVDRMDRKIVLVVCDFVRFLALGSVPLAWWLGKLTLWHLYLVALAQGTAFVFFNVAEYAALTQVVTQEQLPNATALDSTAWSTASLVGPGFAGSVIGLAKSTAAGAVFGYFADSITFLISVFSLLFLRLQPRKKIEEESLAPPNLVEDVKTGLLFVWSRPGLRTLAISTSLLSFLYAPVSLAMIVLAKGPMHAKPVVIGLIFSIAALGGILGSLVAPKLSKMFPVSQLVGGSVAIQALATVAVALASSPVMLTAGWAIAFFLDPILNTAATSYRLKETPQELQGRVQSIYRLGTYGGEPIGAAVGGIAIAAIGARFEILSVAFAVGMCGYALYFGPLRRSQL